MCWVWNRLVDILLKSAWVVNPTEWLKIQEHIVEEKGLLYWPAKCISKNKIKKDKIKKS